MTRHPDWEQRLKRVVEDHMRFDPSWGRSDCFIFACDAFKAVTGRTLLPALRRYRSEAGGYRLFRKHGFAAIEEALASVLERRQILTATRGDLGCIRRPNGVSCGVFTSNGFSVRTIEGEGEVITGGAVVHLPMTEAFVAFRVG